MQDVAVPQIDDFLQGTSFHMNVWMMVETHAFGRNCDRSISTRHGCIKDSRSNDCTERKLQLQTALLGRHTVLIVAISEPVPASRSM
jgi:hypothetical protein